MFCHFLASTEIRHLGLRPPIHKVPYFLEGKVKGVPIFSAFGYHSQISFRVQLMSRHHARKRYMSWDLKGYVL